MGVLYEKNGLLSRVIRLPSRIILEGYKYSSFGNYLGLFNQTWVKPKKVLRQFKQMEIEDSYKSYVEKEDNKEVEKNKKIVLDASLQG